MVKNLSATAGDKRCGYNPLGQEDSLEEGMATYTNILAWRIPMDRGAWPAAALEVAKSQT